MEININDLNFTIKDQDGNEINCDILYEATDSVNGKAYIAYTDYVADESGKYRIIVAELLNKDSYLIAPIDDLNIENAIKEQVYKLYFQNEL